MAHLLKFASYCKEKGNNKEIERMRKAERQKNRKNLVDTFAPDVSVFHFGPTDD